MTNPSEYFEAQPEIVREKLKELKSYILFAAPHATELINYNILAYALVENGKRDQQILIAGFKNHIGFYPHPVTIEKFKTELKPYKSAKGSVQFPLNQRLPKDLIIRMVQYRLELLIK
ncbi:MAG: iron chaperone [Putridiphycobacter sp.]